jgi:integrase
VLNEMNENNLFCDYYEQWVAVYKEGAVRPVTLDKYKMTLSWVKKLAPTLKLCEVSRVTYQQLLNDYAVGHERQTTMDFHHQLKGAIMDAVDDGLIVKDPTRKAIIKGKPPVPKKVKYLNQFELHLLLSDLDLQGKLNWDWMILLIAKTGIRFSEALAITPADFDFSHQMLSINKTWDYKGNGGFLPTKNKSSVRKIQIDWQTVIQFAALVKDVPEDKPIFVFKEHAYNSTVNDVLERHCDRAKIPVISVHGLRHPYVKHTTKIFSLRLMDFQAQAYPDARRKTRGACQLLRVGQSRSPVRPLCNRKRFSCLPPQSKMSWILYAISMRLSGYTSTRSISSSASSVVSVSASKIALDASLRLSCRACSSCFFFACANTAA